MPSSLAAHLGRRITAPLTRANLKRCRKKFAKMQLNPAAAQHSNSAQMDAISTNELYSSSDGSSLFGGGGDRRQLLAFKKLRVKNTATTISETVGATDAEQPNHTEVNSRGRKSKKRLHFLRRSTSRFSSKSAPG
uniref:Uncharacterized protein n=1 Tax=Ceratitis capitata TaxID=7213 RepID=W8AU94_CERCA